MENVLVVKNLKKSFKDKVVLKGISFEVGRGEILCFLGTNGAGKSTTIHILTAALQCDSGEVLYKGQSIGKQLRPYKKELGVVPQDVALYEELSAERNVLFFASKAICEHPTRCEGQCSDLQRDGNGKRERTESVPILEVSV
jgi:ABC-2 type transport system ATP-binding protein